MKKKKIPKIKKFLRVLKYIEKNKTISKNVKDFLLFKFPNGHKVNNHNFIVKCFIIKEIQDSLNEKETKELLIKYPELLEILM